MRLISPWPLRVNIVVERCDAISYLFSSGFAAQGVDSVERFNKEENERDGGQVAFECAHLRWLVRCTMVLSAKTYAFITLQSPSMIAQLRHPHDIGVRLQRSLSVSSTRSSKNTRSIRYEPEPIQILMRRPLACH